jgi:hypothetical protein
MSRTPHTSSWRDLPFPKNKTLLCPLSYITSLLHLRGTSRPITLRRSVDSYMNLQLASTEEWINEKFAGNLGEVLIRCNNVLYIRAQVVAALLLFVRFSLATSLPPLMCYFVLATSLPPPMYYFVLTRACWWLLVLARAWVCLLALSRSCVCLLVLSRPCVCLIVLDLACLLNCSFALPLPQYSVEHAHAHTPHRVRTRMRGA